MSAVSLPHNDIHEGIVQAEFGRIRVVATVLVVISRWAFFRGLVFLAVLAVICPDQRGEKQSFAVVGQNAQVN